MAYDEGLATRVREVLGDRPGLAEKQMFGGLAFVVQGNVACGGAGRGSDRAAGRRRRRVRPGRAGCSALRPDRPADEGLALVAADGHAEDDDLRRWVDWGVAYAVSLPPKGP